MVMPRSRSRSMESSTCASISRAVRAPVSSSSRSASVDFPWSMCATTEKLRMCWGSIEKRLKTLILTGEDDCNGQTCFLAQYFDEKTSRRLKIKCPGAMQARRLGDFDSVFTQLMIDLVYPFFTLLHKTHMKSGWVADLPVFSPEQRQHQPVVIGKESHGFARRERAIVPESRMPKQEFVSRQNVGDGEVQVIEFHWAAPELEQSC